MKPSKAAVAKTATAVKTRAKVPPTRVRTNRNTADALTHETGAGYSRDPKSELFLLAVTNMVGEQTFYESAGARDTRFEALAHQVIRDDPEWVAAFIPALRDRLHMRSASIVLAALYAKGRLDAGSSEPSIRKVISSALLRADEPAELVAYWIGRFGRKIPKPVKRGVADAAVRLYNERNALKWDGDRNKLRMGDVIEMTHPEPGGVWQSALFRYLIDDRHSREYPGLRPGQDTLTEVGLKTVAARKKLEAIPVEDRRDFLASDEWAETAKEAAVTWEWVSGWLQGPMDKAAWEAVIPEMGFMALLRNLRNFDDAKISSETRATVIAKLTDPEEVAKSRQLPLRFYAAYKAVSGKHWSAALEKALYLTLDNIPRLDGRSLVMIDASGSMFSGFSERSAAQRWELASLFGCGFGLRNDSDVYAYDTRTVKIAVREAESILKGINLVKDANLGGGTETWQMVKKEFRPGVHQRVIIVTDEQAWHGADHTVVPEDIPVYTFNVAGYSVGHAPSFNESRRYTFGGLTDAGFEAIAAIEMGIDFLAIPEAAVA